MSPAWFPPLAAFDSIGPMTQREHSDGQPRPMSVRDQYEKFPYPPIPAFALPRRGQGEELRYELGAEMAAGRASGGVDIEPVIQPEPHDGKRILVAGCGSIEALVVAQAHPRAAEVVAVDLSRASIRRLRLRRRLAISRKLPPMNLTAADLHEWSGGTFDYIIATNILQHVPDPGALLGRLAGWLRPGGLMRMVTYPKANRIFVRSAGAWLSMHGLTIQTPSLVRRARQCIEFLGAEHPARLAFENHPESGSAAGIADAFLHACENPLSPHDWGRATRKAGLRLIGQRQTETSRSAFIDELFPAARESKLDAWDKLELLDRLLELCANPVLWFEKQSGDEPDEHEKLENSSRAQSPRSASASTHDVATPDGILLASTTDPVQAAREVEASPGMLVYLASALRSELAENLRCAAGLLGRCGIEIEDALATLRREVGPRVSPPPGGVDLPGLTLSDYDCPELLDAARPWSVKQWREFVRSMPSGMGCVCGTEESANELADADLDLQLARLQLAEGATSNWIGPIVFKRG